MFNPRALKADRHDLFMRADDLITAVKKSGKDLAGADLAKYNSYLSEMKEIDAELERYEAARQQPSLNPGSMFDSTMGPGVRTPVGQPAFGHDPEGRSVPIFAKGQSVAEYTRQEHTDNGVTLGGLARAMVTGRKTPEIQAALSEGTDSAGGITVPVVLSSQIIDQLRARSTVFQAGAQTLVLETGKPTTIAVINSDPVATWRAENAAVATSDMSFTSVSFVPKTLAVCVTASRELIEDSLNLNTALVMSISKAFASELDRVALIGSGSGSEPKGVSKVSGVGSVSMGTNGAALTSYDPFVTAVGAMRTANAADPSAVILHPRSDQELNLLKDSQNRPLSRPAVIQSLPFLVTSKLLINETQGTSNAASRAIMGDFTELIVGVRHSLSIELLREKYSDTLAYGFLAYLRADIAVKHAASFVNVVGIL
jgi:HK97 family phage major capsid protein